jgi:hypothetical protein
VKDPFRLVSRGQVSICLPRSVEPPVSPSGCTPRSYAIDWFSIGQYGPGSPPGAYERSPYLEAISLSFLAVVAPIRTMEEKMLDS